MNLLEKLEVAPPCESAENRKAELGRGKRCESRKTTKGGGKLESLGSRTEIGPILKNER